MEKDLEKLLNQIEGYKEDVEYNHFDKINQSEELKSGYNVEIFWIDRENTDKGYIFQLPNQGYDDYDFCVHVTNVDNSDGMDEAPDEWLHLYSLVELDRVVKVVVSK